MLIFTNGKGAAYPTTVAVDPAVGSLTVYAVDDSGTPVVCNWTLQNASVWGSSYWGTLLGFTAGFATPPAYLQGVKMFGLTSVTYQTPDTTRCKGTIHVLLTAASTVTGEQRTLQIRMDSTIEPEFGS